MNQSVTYSVCQSISQSIYPSINQSIDLIITAVTEDDICRVPTVAMAAALHLCGAEILPEKLSMLLIVIVVFYCSRFLSCNFFKNINILNRNLIFRNQYLFQDTILRIVYRKTYSPPMFKSLLLLLRS